MRMQEQRQLHQLQSQRLELEAEAVEWMQKLPDMDLEARAVCKQEKRKHTFIFPLQFSWVFLVDS